MPRTRLRVCTEPRCPTLTPHGRCDQHQLADYGHAHRKLRARWAPRVARGDVPCARCGNLILPGEAWHLDHDDDRSSYLGPSHADCNSRAPHT